MTQSMRGVEYYVWYFLISQGLLRDFQCGILVDVCGIKVSIARRDTPARHPLKFVSEWCQQAIQYHIVTLVVRASLSEMTNVEFQLALVEFQSTLVELKSAFTEVQFCMLFTSAKMVTVRSMRTGVSQMMPACRANRSAIANVEFQQALVELKSAFTENTVRHAIRLSEYGHRSANDIRFLQMMPAVTRVCL